MKGYMSSILDHKKNNSSMNAEDSKKVEEKERVEMGTFTSEEGEFREEKALEKTVITEVNPEPETLSYAESGLDNEERTKKALDSLENYRKSIFMEGDGSVYYFHNNGKNIIDIVSIIHHITKILDKVKILYEQLSQTVSPQEKFDLKQDAINNQYTLRDLIKKSIKMCTQDSYSLPDHTIDIINIQSFKEMLDILDIQNWSKEYEFKAFINHFESLSKAIIERVTPPDAYMLSIFRAIRDEDPQRKPFFMQ